MAGFDIIEYIGSLTGFAFEKPTLERIAMERGVLGADSYESLTERDRDLLLADLLLVIYTTPSQSASMRKAHAGWEMSVGSQVIEGRKGLYDMMLRLYRKWRDPKLEMLEDLDGSCKFLDF